MKSGLDNKLMKTLTPKLFKFPLNAMKESEKIHEALSINFFISSSRNDKTDKKRIKLSGFAFLDYLFDHRYFIYNNYIPSWERSSFFPASIFFRSFDTLFHTQTFSSFKRPLEFDKNWSVLKNQIYNHNLNKKTNLSKNDITNNSFSKQYMPNQIFNSPSSIENVSNEVFKWSTQTPLVAPLQYPLFQKTQDVAKRWGGTQKSRNITDIIINESFFTDQYNALLSQNSQLWFDSYRLLNKNFPSDLLAFFIYNNKQKMLSYFDTHKNIETPPFLSYKKLWPNAHEAVTASQAFWTKENYPLYFTTSTTLLKTLTWRFFKKTKQTHFSKIWPWFMQESPLKINPLSSYMNIPVLNNFKQQHSKIMTSLFENENNSSLLIANPIQSDKVENLIIPKKIDNQTFSASVFSKDKTRTRLLPRHSYPSKAKNADSCFILPFKNSKDKINKNCENKPLLSKLSKIDKDSSGLFSALSSNRLLASLVSILNTTNFRDVLFERFMNTKFYDIGLMGRKRLNKKLRLNIPLQCTTLTPLDFLAIFYKLFSLYNHFNLIHNGFSTEGNTPLKIPFLGDSFIVNPKINPWSSSISEMDRSLGSVTLRQFLSTNIKGATLPIARSGVGNVFKPRNNLLDTTLKQTGSLDHLNQRHIRTSGEFLFLQFWRAILRFYQVLSQLSNRTNFLLSSNTAAGKTGRNFFSLSSISLFPYIKSRINNETEYILPISNNQAHVFKAYGYVNPTNSNQDNFNSYQYQCFQNTMSGEFVINSNNTTFLYNRLAGSYPNNFRRETLNIIINRNDLNSILPYTPYFQTSSVYAHKQETWPYLKVSSWAGSGYKKGLLPPLSEMEKKGLFLNTSTQKTISTYRQFENFVLKQNERDSTCIQLYKILLNKIHDRQNFHRKSIVDNSSLMFKAPPVVSFNINQKYFIEGYKKRNERSLLDKTGFNFSNFFWPEAKSFKKSFLKFSNKNHWEPHKLKTGILKTCNFNQTKFGSFLVSQESSSSVYRSSTILQAFSNLFFPKKLQTRNCKREDKMNETMGWNPKNGVSNLEEPVFNSKIETIIKKLLYETKDLRVFDAKERMRNLEIKLFNGVFKEFFNLDPLSQDLDETNGLSEIIHKRRISALGKGGVTSKNAPLSIRSIHPSFYGRLCPIDSPEGDRVGLINSLTNYARINSIGYIATPFYRTRNHDNLEPNTFGKSQKFFNLNQSRVNNQYYEKNYDRKIIPSATRNQRDEISLLAKKSTLQMRICPPIAFFGKIYHSYSVSPSVRLSSQDIIYSSPEAKEKKTLKLNNHKQNASKQMIFQINSNHIERTYKYFMKSSYLRPNQIKGFPVEMSLMGMKPITGNSFIYSSKQSQFRSTEIHDFRATLEPMPSFGLSKNQQRGSTDFNFQFLAENLKANIKNDFSYMNQNLLTNKNNQNVFRELELFLFYDTHYMIPPITHRETIINNAKDKNMGHIYTPFLTCYFDFVSFQGYAPITAFQFFSPGVGLIPFLEHDDGTRALMGANMQRQAVPLISASRPIVGTGLEKNIAASFIISSPRSGYLYYISGKQSKEIFSDFQSPVDQLNKTYNLKRLRRKTLVSNVNTQLIQKIQFLNDEFPLKYFGSKKFVKSTLTNQWKPSIFNGKSIFPLNNNRNGLNQIKKTNQDFFNRNQSFPFDLNGKLSISQLPFFFYSPPVHKAAAFRLNMANTQKTLVNRKTNLNGFVYQYKQTITFDFKTLFLNTDAVQTFYNQKRILKFKKPSLFWNIQNINALFVSKNETYKAPPENYNLNPWQQTIKHIKKVSKKITRLRPSANKKGYYFILNTHWLPYRKSYKATIINKKPAISENCWLQKGDLLVDGTSSINGELALGRNLFSIYMPWEGYNFEDAILISDKAAQSYTTIHVEEFSVKISKNEFVSSIVKPFTWINLGDILVSKKRKLENEFIMNRLLFGMSSKPKMKNLDNDFLNNSVSDYNFYGNKPFFNSREASPKKKNPLYDQKMFSYSVSPWQNKLWGNSSKHIQNFTKVLTMVNQPKEKNFNRGQQAKLPLSFNESSKLAYYSYLKNLEYKPIFCLNTFKDQLTCEMVKKQKVLKKKLNLHYHFSLFRYKPVFIAKNNGFVSKRGNKLEETLNDCSQISNTFHKITISGKTSFLVEQPSIIDHESARENVTMLDDKPSSLIGINEKDLKLLNSRGSDPQFSFGGSLKKNDNFEIDTSYRTGESICGWVISVKSKSQQFLFSDSENKNRVSVFDNKTQMLERNQSKNSMVIPSVQKSALFRSFIEKNNASLFWNIQNREAEQNPNTSNNNLNTINSESTLWPLSKRIAGVYKNYIQKFLGLLNHFHKNVQLKNAMFYNIKKPWTFRNDPKNFTKPHTLKKSPFNSPPNRYTENKPWLLNVNSRSIPRIKTEGDPLKITKNLRQPPGSDMIYIYVAVAKPLQVGDKMSGRHGNKGIISKILPFYDMPYLIDGTPIDIILNPLGVPSRMNVGQIYESLLGLTGFYKHEYYRIPPFDENYSSQFSRNFVYWKLNELKRLHFFTPKIFDHTNTKSHMIVSNRNNSLVIGTPLKTSIPQMLPRHKCRGSFIERDRILDIQNTDVDMALQENTLKHINGFCLKNQTKKALLFKNKILLKTISASMFWTSKTQSPSFPPYLANSKKMLMKWPKNKTYNDVLKVFLTQNFKKNRFEDMVRVNKLTFAIPTNFKDALIINWNTSLLWCPKLKLWDPLNQFLKSSCSNFVSINSIFRSVGSVFKKNWFFTFAPFQSKYWLSSKPIVNFSFFSQTKTPAKPLRLSRRLPIVFYRIKHDAAPPDVLFQAKPWAKTQNYDFDTIFLNKNRPKVEKFGLNPYFPGKMRLLNGLTGETFYRPIIVGKSYMLKLIHLVHHKIHARATGPYALITQQPLKGKRNQGGQRMGEMEIWALYGFGSASVLYEMLTIKSDDPVGRERILREIAGLKGNNASNANWKNNDTTGVLSLRESTQFWKNEEPALSSKINDSLEKGISESFRVLVMNLRALCLDMQVFKDLAN